MKPSRPELAEFVHSSVDPELVAKPTRSAFERMMEMDLQQLSVFSEQVSRKYHSGIFFTEIKTCPISHYVDQFSYLKDVVYTMHKK